MTLGVLFFLSSGLFLGWSLGANDAANVFGTAVGSRMVRFGTAALICSVFVIVGAVLGGSGAAHTLGRLGSVNALAGAFTVALSAALSTFAMTRAGLPVSTSQAIVGAIIGWNLYAGMITDTGALTSIVLSWVLCPLLAGVAAVVIFLLLKATLGRAHIHLLRQDALVRAGLILVGAFGAYSLGANNIANVMGVFLPDNPFPDRELLGMSVTGVQQLFMLGGVAIAVGVMTYSGKVMRTVGGGIMRLSPEAALVVVMAQALVLFVFASEELEAWLLGHGLPSIPLVPVSSSQAVIGAIVGLGLLRGGRMIRLRPLGSIGLGWLATPAAAGVTAFVLLFVVDNVFDQTVARTVHFRVDEAVTARMEDEGVPASTLADLLGTETTNGLSLQKTLERDHALARHVARRVVGLAEVAPIHVDLVRINRDLDPDWLGVDQMRAVRSLAGLRFDHTWQLYDALAQASPLWRLREDIPLNRLWNKEVRQKREFLVRTFRDESQP